MINKNYKRIYNKYSILLKFFFFLRYIFAIFIFATSLFLIIPKYFNYEKRINSINEYLINQYDLKLNNYSDIKFKIFPFPHLMIKNANLEINKSININSSNVNIFLYLNNIYDYKNFKAKTIHINQSEILLELIRFKELTDYVDSLKNKLKIKNLKLTLKKDKKTLINIIKISFSNYGYKRFEITGEVFKKKFIVSIKDRNKKINFKLLNTGIKADFKLNEKKLNNFITGSSKINLSNNLLKFNFNANDNELKINKSIFRNKDLSFSWNSVLRFNPFFSTESNVIINEFDKDLLKKISLNKILENRKILKKFNSKIYLNYISKKYFSDLVESYSSEIDLSYGRVVFSKKIKISGGKINCNGNSSLSEEYPRLDFVCLFELTDKKKFFRKMSISQKIKKNLLKLNIEGYVNLVNKKINFKKINNDENYQSNEEDLIYFKNKFESILLEDGFFKIFNKKKFKDFILEII